MKESIDIDFHNNYVAIWNDESHWNKYVLDHANPIDGHPTVVLGPEYIYPDSLVKEYYEPIWGRKLEPKIITLTKPFTLSKQAASEINTFLGKEQTFHCPTCKDGFDAPGHKIVRVVNCPGSGKPHQMDLQKI